MPRAARRGRWRSPGLVSLRGVSFRVPRVVVARVQFANGEIDVLFTAHARGDELSGVLLKCNISVETRTNIRAVEIVDRVAVEVVGGGVDGGIRPSLTVRRLAAG